MNITTKKSHFNSRLGQWPQFAMPPAWYAQEPFRDTSALSGLSASLILPEEGITHGHNVMTDSGFMDGLLVDREVPISPLFARDLAGRAIYLGYGPEIKDNEEWEAYQPPVGEDGKIDPALFNPFVPLVCFPRHCRDVAEMPGAELLEETLFCKFRCVEMPTGFHVLPSGGDAEEDELIAPTYNGANLYPYKLRLDTFYPDGYRLPQTQMLFARGPAQGVDVEKANLRGTHVLEAWENREAGMSYADWYEGLGDAQREALFAEGCTLIPTFEAHNGYAVVGRNFGIEDYWPGRAVAGLHDIAEMRADSAPRGTILDVIQPGYVTANRVVPAVVIISDGSGYVSPNASDPLPMVPNLNLPHSRTAPNWRACWLPTHPEHFEAPAMWGWDPESGKFLQLLGPLWAPLYYFYGCTDSIIDAYEFPEPYAENASLLPVPAQLKGRFWPIVPMPGFDTFDVNAREARRVQGSKLRSIIVREETTEPTAGIAYHPLPMEFEFECEPFWFPELHPLNRNHGMVPEELMERIAPVVSPKVKAKDFAESVRGVDVFRGSWLKDEMRLADPQDDVLENYPHLVRYLVPDLDLKDIMRICPVPILSDLGDLLKQPATQWWADDEGTERDTPEAMEQLGPGLHDMLWDARENGAMLVKFRHMVYQTNLPLYILSYWYGASPQMMQSMMETWIETSESSLEEAAQTLRGEGAGAPAATTVTLPAAMAEEDELSEAEKAQLRAIEAMAAARERNRLVTEQTPSTPESMGAKPPKIAG